MYNLKKFCVRTDRHIIPQCCSCMKEVIQGLKNEVLKCPLSIAIHSSERQTENNYIITITQTTVSGSGECFTINLYVFF